MSDFVIENGVLKEYEGKGGDVVIPEGITEIAYCAFYKNKRVKNVTIPDGVSVIGNDAFKGCVNLESVNIPDSVAEINGRAFENCEKLESVIIPDSVTKMGRGVFASCKMLKNIVLPKSLKEINDETFAYCESLTEINIPDEITKLGDSAFYRCSNLTEVKLPKKLNVIEKDAFSDTPFIKKLAEDNGGFAVINGILLKYCGSSADVSVPAGIKSVNAGAFSGCDKIKNLEVPENVSFDSNAADNLDIERYFIPGMTLSDLKPDEKIRFSIYYLSSAESHSDEETKMYLTYIKKQKKAVIEKVIENNIFNVFNKILELKIITVKDIDSYIELCNKGGKTEALAMLMEYKNKNFSSEEVAKEETRKVNKELNSNPVSLADLKKAWAFEELGRGKIKLTSYKGKETEVIVPDKIENKKVTALGKSIFSPRQLKIRNAEVREKITSITIPNSVTDIEDYAFNFCSSLKSVNIPHGVTVIGDWAFNDCKSLVSITLPSSVKEIKWNAFNECRNLASIVIPESVTEIDSSAFGYCKDLTIHAPAGSYAEQYAKEHNKKFEPTE